MSNAILYRMAQGIPGAISRPGALIEGQPLNSGTPFASFGIPVKYSGGYAVPITAVGDVIQGFLVRSFPMTGPNASDPIGTSAPPTSGVASVMNQGYMTVQCNAGTPALGGAVYVRYANAAGGTPIGGIEAAAVASTTVAIPGAVFTCAADAGGNVEIRFNL
jgi:hypothetical protein